MIKIERKLFLFSIFFQLLHVNVETTSPSDPPCDGAQCINLCCPPGQAFTLTGQDQGGRCEAEPRMERRCQPHQELPGWSVEWGKAGQFVCSEGAQLVPAEVLYGPQVFSVTENKELSFVMQDFYRNVTENVTYSSSDFCLVFTDIPDYYDYEEEGSGNGNSEDIRALYSVCYTQEEEKGREFTGIFYPAAIFISDFFILITICVYLFVKDIRKNIFGKITIGFLSNVFICYTFLGIHYSLDLFSHKQLLDTVFCKVLGYIIQHTFIGFFFWMSAMAFNVTYTFSNTFSMRKSSNQLKSLMINICYAQGFPLLITGVTIGMDFFGPCHYILPNMGKFSCFLGSEFNPEQSFFKTSEFLYFYLVISIIMVSNIICFIITGSSLISHWWQMRDLQSSLNNTGLQTQFGIVFKLFIIMGIPWTCDIISAVVGHAYGNGKSFEIRLLLDILNLLTGVLIFLVLVCKKEVVKSVKAQVLSPTGVKPSLTSQTSNYSKSSISSRTSVSSHISYNL